MSFNKMYFTDQQVFAEHRIKKFLAENDLQDTDEERAGVISLLEDFGIEIDACSICGSMPMNTNCNNAGCDV